MDPKAPTVSVVIGTYNRGRVARDRAIRSIRAQTFKDWECIVISDGSMDETEAIMTALMKEDPRIRYFRFENGGASVAKNHGIEHARGRFVAFTDDDDEFLPDYLEFALEEFKRSPEISFLSSGSYLIDDRGNESYILPPLEPFWKSSVGNGWIFRREALFDHKIFFDPYLRGFEDIDFLIRLREHGYKGKVIDRPGRTYYINLTYKKFNKSSISADTVHQQSSGERFLERNEAKYISYGSKALAYIYLFVGLVNLRDGRMARGRDFLKKSLKNEFSLKTLLFLFAGYGGKRFFDFYDNFKNRAMRLMRTIFIDKSPRTKENRFTAFLKKLFPPVYIWDQKELIERTKDAESILDLGCGFNSYVQYLDKRIYRVGVDLFDEYIEKSKQAGIHDEYIKQDLRDLKNFKDRSFDVVYASDVVEHLTKQEGLAFIKNMERIARKRIIISTPNGHRHQKMYDGNELQEHHSAWSVKDFRDLGFKVLGMDGLRALRGDRSDIRFRPHRFWSFVANLTQFFIYHAPRQAHTLFCVKEIS